MPPIAIIVLGGLAAIALFGAIGAIVSAQKRKERAKKEAFEDLATDMGLTYEENAPTDFRDAWSVLPEIPKQGEVHHLMYGTLDGLPVTFFRHRYVVSTGQTTAVIIHWVFSSEVPDWPEVHIKRRSFFARAFGGRSTVTNDDRFNREWIVKTDDPAFARTLLREQAIELIGAPRPDSKRLRESWHVVGGKLCCVVRASLDAPALRTQARRLHLMLETFSGERFAPR